MAEMDSKEFKKSIINGLIEQGKKNGMLLHKDIALALEEIEMTPEEIETIYEIKKHYVQIAKPGQTRHSVIPFQTAFLNMPHIFP